jgi:signal transduction histidine kinase
MTPNREVGARPHPNPAVDVALLVLALGLTAFTATVLSVPAAAPAIINDRLDMGIITAGTLVSLAVAGINWARGRVSGDGAALVRGSAFAVLFALNVLILLVQVLGIDAAVGASLQAPGELPIIAGVLTRAVAAGLLVVAGVLALREPRVPLTPAALVIGPAAVLTAALFMLAGTQDRLPMLAPQSTLDHLASMPEAPLSPGSAPLLVLVQSIIGLGFLAAAVLAHRSYRAHGRAGQALLAAGLLVAGFSQAHGVIHPGGLASLVTTGDILRLAFYVTLLGGIVVDSRDDLRELREANVEIRRLADADLATATLEERARLAREIHDGLAQDLWYAKLKQTRLAQLAAFEGEERQLSDDVGSAIDAALAEARQAVSALREGVEAGSLVEMLTRHVEDFSDRFALRAELSSNGPMPHIGPRAQAEILRIVQEAMTNARKHADATVVRVDIVSDGDLRLSVTDNGRGFVSDEATPGFGLVSMRQRAAVIGASLAVRSEPHSGTSVELVLPIAARGTTNGG